MYVHLNFKPDNNDQYYYRAEGSAAKRIIVSSRDLKGMQLTDNKLYVKVVCDNSCKYIIKSHTVEGNVFSFSPGYTETSLLAPKEYRQHLIESKDYNGEKVEKHLRIKLQTFTGQANL